MKMGNVFALFSHNDCKSPTVHGNFYIRRTVHVKTIPKCKHIASPNMTINTRRKMFAFFSAASCRLTDQQSEEEVIEFEDFACDISNDESYVSEDTRLDVKV
jgi:hypothetical protein